MNIKHLRSLMFSLCVMTMPLTCSPGQLIGVPVASEPMMPEAPSSLPDTELQPKKLVLSDGRPKTTHLANRKF